MSVNINREVQDAFYRYKMPRLQSKIEGKGNGIKTVVTNMEEVARSLARPPSYPTKFFGCELGAQTIMDDKASRYIVNGAHDTPRLAELLDVFIKKFVLCFSCSNPETDMVIDRKQNLLLNCKACGAISRADMTNKLITYILKNPPATAGNAAGSGGAKKKTKEERRKERQLKNPGSKRGSDNEDDNADDDDPSPTPKSNGTASRTPSNVGDEEEEAGMQFTPVLGAEGSDPTSSMPSPGAAEDDDEEFSADVIAAAEALRQADLNSMNDGIRRLIANDTAQVEKVSAADAASQFADAASKATAGAELTALYEKLKLRADRAAAVAVQVWFEQALVAELPKRVALMQQFVKGKSMQLGLLGGLERLLYQNKDWQKDISRVLKYLYDRDVVEEEVVLEWADSTSNDYVKQDVAKAIRSHAAPFIEWLRNAEEESDEEDDE